MNGTLYMAPTTATRHRADFPHLLYDNLHPVVLMSIGNEFRDCDGFVLASAEELERTRLALHNWPLCRFQVFREQTNKSKRYLCVQPSCIETSAVAKRGRKDSDPIVGSNRPLLGCASVIHSSNTFFRILRGIRAVSISALCIPTHAEPVPTRFQLLLISVSIN